jgi:hypothetical protein
MNLLDASIEVSLEPVTQFWSSPQAAGYLTLKENKNSIFVPLFFDA